MLIRKQLSCSALNYSKTKVAPGYLEEAREDRDCVLDLETFAQLCDDSEREMEQEGRLSRKLSVHLECLRQWLGQGCSAPQLK